MSLTVSRFNPTFEEWEDTRKATPQEALTYALTCSECDGKGKIYFDRKIAGRIFPDDKPCDRCVDGVPRWAIETVEATLDEVLPPYGTRFREPILKGWIARLVALRDREDTSDTASASMEETE